MDEEPFGVFPIGFLDADFPIHSESGLDDPDEISPVDERLIVFLFIFDDLSSWSSSDIAVSKQIDLRFCRLVGPEGVTTVHVCWWISATSFGMLLNMKKIFQ